jgi:hypothetical protein
MGGVDTLRETRWLVYGGPLVAAYSHSLLREVLGTAAPFMNLIAE